MENLIPVHRPRFAGNEIKYLTECIQSGWVSSEGPFVSLFESKMAVYTDRKYAAAVSSGTAALDLAFEALELKKGDEVIVPTFTIISCVNAIIRAGATPVLVDCDPESFNMTADLIREKVSPKTKAILVVHLYGLPCEMDKILSLAKEFNLKIVEDAAEMLGQSYQGKKCGSFGDISVFSFYGNKIVTTGEGGMVLTNDQSIDKKIRSFRNLCFEEERRFQHKRMGWNYRMTNLQAALGVAQLEQLDENIRIKKRLARRYHEGLDNLPGIKTPLKSQNGEENIYWVYPVLFDSELENQKVFNHLKNNGVMTRSFFVPMNSQSVFTQTGLFEGVSCPVAESISRRGIYLPFGAGVSVEEVNKVIKLLGSYL